MPQTQEAPAVTGTQDWRADYAYTVGVQAFIYGFPYIHNAKLPRCRRTRRASPVCR